MNIIATIPLQKIASEDYFNSMQLDLSQVPRGIVRIWFCIRRFSGEITGEFAAFCSEVGGDDGWSQMSGTQQSFDFDENGIQTGEFEIDLSDEHDFFRIGFNVNGDPIEGVVVAYAYTT